MQKFLKWVGMVGGSIILLLIVVGSGLFFYGRSRLTTAPTVQTTSLTIPTDRAAIERGEHIYQAVSACAACHGADLAGNLFIDEAPIGYLPAPNLTTGEGGIGGSLSAEDWERAIRHGVGWNGHTLVTMPSTAYANLSDQDTAALIAYLMQVEPIDNDLGSRELLLPGNIIFGVLAYSSHSVNIINHANVGLPQPANEPSAEHGNYLTAVGACAECHGANLAGSDNAETPHGPNITPGGSIGGWAEAQFIETIRTGAKPSGITMSEEMPWLEYQHMSDTELKAIYAYLQSLPELPTNPAP